MSAATIIATGDDARRMVAAGTDLTASLPPDALVTLCGGSLVVSLPSTGTAAPAAALRALLPGAGVIEQPAVLLIHGTMAGDSGWLATIDAFTSGLQTPRLIAPWDPGDPRSADQRARDDEVRAVGVALIEHLRNRADDAQSTGAGVALYMANEADDRAAASAARMQQMERRQALFSACLDRLAGEHPLADEAIAACRTALPQADDDNFGVTLAAKLKPWLGTTDDDNPYGLAYAGVTSADRHFQLVLNLNAPGVALPAVVAWLHRQGARDLRYLFLPHEE